MSDTEQNPLFDTDISEKGRSREGNVISSDRRLFMLFYAFGNSSYFEAIGDSMTKHNVQGVVYSDLHDPHGIGLLTYHEDPAILMNTVHTMLRQYPFEDLVQKHEYTMLGRTYTIGYEPDLDEALVHRPIRKVNDPKHKWAIYYPLKRTGAFQQLPAKEQRTILAEHGGIGRAFGRAGYGTDIRLASFGLDKHDNDFVIGLVGPELYPLSAIVERMRKTKQTAHYMEKMGPFFVGKAVWQTDLNL